MTEYCRISKLGIKNMNIFMFSQCLSVPKVKKTEMFLQPESHSLVVADSLDGYVIVKYTYICVQKVFVN